MTTRWNANFWILASAFWTASKMKVTFLRRIITGDEMWIPKTCNRKQ
jgi:hypothetical protein